jgi:hypothetical protein
VLHNGVRKGTAAGINVQDAAGISGIYDGFPVELGADYTTPASRKPSRLFRPRSATFYTKIGDLLDHFPPDQCDTIISHVEHGQPDAKML